MQWEKWQQNFGAPSNDSSLVEWMRGILIGGGYLNAEMDRSAWLNLQEIYGW